MLSSPLHLTPSRSCPSGCAALCDLLRIKRWLSEPKTVLLTDQFSAGSTPEAETQFLTSQSWVPNPRRSLPGTGTSAISHCPCHSTPKPSRRLPGPEGGQLPLLMLCCASTWIYLPPALPHPTLPSVGDPTWGVFFISFKRGSSFFLRSSLEQL